MSETSSPVQLDPRLTRRRALAVLGASALAPLAACQTPAPETSAAPVGPFHFLSLQEIASHLAERRVSPVALTRQMLERIAALDGGLASYATVMADQAIAAATEAEREIATGKYRGPLHGVPIAVKDLCYTRGVRTMAGTSVLKDHVPEFDATVVAKLQAAGAVILGKLNLTEGAMVGYHPERGIPLNPWDRSRWPGLSSSGSGVAAAAGLCFASIGTDTGGSIRYPSSACGLAGLKPTYGRVSRHGVWGLSQSLDHVGPMARRVADVAIMFDAIAGHDPQDATSLTDPTPSTVAQLGQRIDGLRLGIDRDYALKGIEPGQAASIEAALKVLAGLGAQIVDVKMPDLTPNGERVGRDLRARGARVPQGVLPVSRQRLRPLFPAGARMGRLCDTPAAGTGAGVAPGLHGALCRAHRIGGCDRLPGWRRTRVAGHSRAASRAVRGVHRRVEQSRAEGCRIHDADEPGGDAGDLPAVRLLARRSAVLDSVCGSAFERTAPVPHRARLRASDVVAYPASTGVVM